MGIAILLVFVFVQCAGHRSGSAIIAIVRQRHRARDHAPRSEPLFIFQTISGTSAGRTTWWRTPFHGWQQCGSRLWTRRHCPTRRTRTTNCAPSQRTPPCPSASMADMFGAKVQHTTSYHPEANGQVECLHRPLKAAIMCRLGRSPPRRPPRTTSCPQRGRPGLRGGAGVRRAAAPSGGLILQRRRRWRRSLQLARAPAPALRSGAPHSRLPPR